MGLRERRFDRCARRGAFTLVELLVVVAILVVLIALLMPAINQVRRAAQSVVCMGNLRQCYQTVLTYDVAAGDYYPVVMSNTAPATGTIKCWVAYFVTGWNLSFTAKGPPLLARTATICPSTYFY